MRVLWTTASALILSVLLASVFDYEPQLSSVVAGVLPFDQLIAVEFRADEKLGMLVPYEMKEEFFAGRLVPPKP